MNRHRNIKSNSFIHALDGIQEALKTQFNFRVHAAAAVLATGAGILLRLSPGEWCVVILSIGLVAAAECFNTAIEYLTDLVMPRQHAVAGKIKDLAAGAVLICATAAAIAGLVVFTPRLLALF